MADSGTKMELTSPHKSLANNDGQRKLKSVTRTVACYFFLINQRIATLAANGGLKNPDNGLSLIARLELGHL